MNLSSSKTDEERRSVQLAHDKLVAALAQKDKEVQARASEVDKAVAKASELNILVTDLSATNSSITTENSTLRDEVRRHKDTIVQLGEARVSETERKNIYSVMLSKGPNDVLSTLSFQPQRGRSRS